MMYLVPHKFVAGLTVIAAAAQVGAQCDRFTMQIVNPSCGFGTAYTPCEMSEDDRICGYYHCGLGDDKPFVWHKGVVTDIPLLPQTTEGRALDVNANAQVVGNMRLFSGGNSKAFLFSNGEVIDLGYLPGANMAEALAINAGGIVCGYTNNSLTGPLCAFVWQGGQMNELKLPMGPNAVAKAINDDGMICGWMGDAPDVPGYTSHAFVWSAGELIDLGTIPDGVTGNAVAINNKGEMIVRGLLPGTAPITRSYLWRKGQWINLGVLPGNVRCYATGINDECEIVGYCTADPGLNPFIWRDGIMTLLDDLVELNGLNLSFPRGINNAGKITASVSQNGGGYVGLLSPFPGLPGDVNCDNIIGPEDILCMISLWGTSGGGTIADLNSDGIVNVEDLLLVIINWNDG